MDALILFSHGSVLCGAGEALEAHAARIRARGEFAPVEIGYLNYSEPPFVEAVGKCMAAGAKRIIVAPYFLISGYFITNSLPQKIAEAFNYDESLADALWESALASHPPTQWRDPLKRAADACRPSPQCPLYGTPSCPKVPTLPRS